MSVEERDLVSSRPVLRIFMEQVDDRETGIKFLAPSLHPCSSSFIGTNSMDGSCTWQSSDGIFNHQGSIQQRSGIPINTSLGTCP